MNIMTLGRLVIEDRPQTVGEEIANAISHGIGFLGAIASLPVLVAVASRHGSAMHVVAAGVFSVTMMVLYLVSALYHAAPEGETKAFLNRLDHAAIYLFIAGTYTPFALMLLDGRNARILLGLVWGGALLGIAFRIFWIGAPRWLYLPVYIALGWAAIFWLGDFASTAGPAVLTLIIVGGGLYSVGGLIYGLKRPNPIPRWFGFHEVFHSFTIAAFVVHYVGVSMIVYSAR